MRLLTYITLLLALFFSASGISQTTLTGKVQDESGKPLGASSVFLASTSFGTMANDQGNSAFQECCPAGTTSW